ncbi:uncharacterized protein LOC122637520 [Vespula pensylvanica]|uniref:Calponin-homology (CH) domain-containing protein n=1 Tax=Vespula pensylvanica TaxID=30213 RepID=A0A834PAV7_VESPE|nr:uncharacterized protein LOC122637520 [Vespula pensylvanica]KAF7434696.1 hypothetical protein H0235_002887 [Vespula pensylvanica]
MNDTADQCEYKKDQSDILKELCVWIESIPFSKPKKNISPLSLYRDFSDGVLLAEILKYYYPRYVDLHNYIPANNFFLKKDNWNTLNRKVLTKIDMKLSKDIISLLANCHQGSIEKLLFEIKNKVERINHQDVLLLSEMRNDELGNNDNIKSLENLNQIIENKDSIEILASKNVSIKEFSVSRQLKINCIKGAIMYAAKWLFSWFCFWNFFLTYRQRNNITEEIKIEVDQEDEDVPHQICIQLKQELREKDNLICTLNHKIAYLEGAMKLKDLRISGLTSQIVQNAVEMDNFGKCQGNEQSKTRVRFFSNNNKRNENEINIINTL